MNGFRFWVSLTIAASSVIIGIVLLFQGKESIGWFANAIATHAIGRLDDLERERKAARR